MLKGKSLLEETNLFSPNDYGKNNKIILKYFQFNPNKLKCFVMFVINIENFKKLKYHIFLKKTSILCFAYRECGHKYKKIFKEEESTEILKSLGLTSNKKSIRKYKIMNQFRSKKI